MQRVVLVAAVALLAATLAGYAGSYWWFLDLFVHFRVHYLVGAALLAVVSAVARAPAGGVVSLLCLVLNGAPVLTFAAQPSLEPDGHATPVKLVAANIRNSDGEQSGQIADFVRREQPDVLLLIELTAPALQALQSTLRELYPHHYALPRSDYFGIGVFSRYRLQDHRLLDLGYRDVPAISVRVAAPQGTLHLVGVHLEWPMTRAAAAARNRQLDALAEQLNDGGDPLVLLGDFNTTRWDTRFATLLAATGLRDTAAGFVWQPTWPTFLPGLGIAIDHCLASPRLAVTARRIGPDIGSDHYPLIVELAPRGEP